MVVGSVAAIGAGLAAIGAGMGETVIILDEGSGARQILNDAQAPIRSIVVGIVDAVELGQP